MSVDRIELMEGEMAKLIRGIPTGECLNISFGPGHVWLMPPYKQNQLEILADLRGIALQPNKVSEEQI